MKNATVTVSDAVRCIKGVGGAVVRSMPDDERREFSAKAEELGRRIAADNSVPFETGEVPDNTPLSPEACKLLKELRVIKRNLLVD